MGPFETRVEANFTEAGGDDDIQYFGDWEVHPTTDGRWAVVSPKTGNVYATFGKEGAAIKLAKEKAKTESV